MSSNAEFAPSAAAARRTDPPETMPDATVTPIMTADPRARPAVRTIGREATPLIVIDDFAIDTGGIVRYARSSGVFAKEGTSAYPGLRSPLPRGYVTGMLDGLFGLLYRTYAIPHDLRLRPQNAVYSLVTLPPAELKLSQSVPHFDSSRRWYFAITHYLNAGDFGGTGFFRHRPTGFENILEERVAEYVRAGEAFVAGHGTPPPAYARASDDHYELYDEVAYRPNRLVVYPGSLLHSGLIDPVRDLSADPASGRLTANVFVDFR